MATSYNESDRGKDRSGESSSGFPESLVRHQTGRGEAVLALVLDQETVSAKSKIRFRLANRGRVELLADLRFVVEGWDGEAWSMVRDQERGGLMSMWPDIGVSLPPGTSTQVQEWPVGGASPTPGRYRVVKSARYEGDQRGDEPYDLVVRAPFRLF